MKKWIRRTVFILMLMVFLGSGSVVLDKMQQSYEAEQAYAGVEELAGLTKLTELSDEAEAADTAAEGDGLGAEVPLAEGETAGAEILEEEPEEPAEEPEAPAEEPKKKEVKKSTPIPEVTMEGLKKLDMDALKKVNGDVEGWILLPGTDISYPVMQAEDNEYYLSRTWDRSWNWMGSVFFEAENAADLSGFNTIIYGHNMRNRSMFSSLLSYSSETFWKNHTSVYLANEEGVYRYDIFAAYEVEVDGHPYWLEYADETVKKYFIQQSIKMSDIDTGIEPETSDRFLTLSTCTGTGHETRWVVQAVLASG